MISFREEYFKSFLKEDILKSSSFSELKKGLKNVSFHGPNLDKEEESFINKAKRIVELIQDIFKKPHLTIKSEKTILRSDIASSIDNQSFLKTIEDSSLWKRKDGLMAPEYVHIKLTTDTYVLYENIFICSVLDFIFYELNNLYRNYEKRAATLENKFETNEVTYSKYGFISRLDDYSYPFDDILSGELNSDYKKTKLLFSLLKRCTHLKNTAFYKEVSIAKARFKEIIMTNILTKDRRYFLCYKFFKEYIGTKSEKEFLEMYKDYLFLRIINDLNKGYYYAPRSYRAHITYDDNIEVEKLSLYNKYFNYYIEKYKDGFDIKVKLRKDEVVMTKHFLLPVLEINNDNIESINALVNEKYLEGYESVIVLCLKNNTRVHHNFVTISYEKEDDKENAINNIFKSYSLVFKCSTEIYEEICPRCGRKGIVVNENDYQCPSCSTSYRKINIDDIECLWLKSLGR